MYLPSPERDGQIRTKKVQGLHIVFAVQVLANLRYKTIATCTDIYINAPVDARI